MHNAIDLMKNRLVISKKKACKYKPNGLPRDAYSREGERSTVGSSVMRRLDARVPGLRAPELTTGSVLYGSRDIIYRGTSAD